jgi:hypothetical protein
MSFEVEFQDESLRSFLKNFQTKIKNVENGEQKFLGLMSAVVFKDVIKHFEQEQGSEGKWQQWSDSYRVHMEEIGKSGNKILQFTGRLRNNFKPQNVKKSREGFVWYNDAKTSNGFPYAFAHNEGGDILPKRDFMWLSDSAIEEMSQQTLSFILDEGI